MALSPSARARAFPRLQALEDRSTPASVAVFDNPTYVDTSGGLGSESDNLQASLTARGHAVNTFTDITPAGFAAAVAGRMSSSSPNRRTPTSPPTWSTGPGP
jgi:hypothetical protein